MSNPTRDEILLEIERLRGDVTAMINRNADALREQVLKNYGETESSPTFERIYPLASTPSIFKGTKPIAVLFGEEEAAVKTWREVYAVILRRCDAEKHEQLMELRGKIAGRDRIILAAAPEGMKRPIQICEEMYAESFFDSESLTRVLTSLILTPVGFDYTGIKISVRPGRGRHG